MRLLVAILATAASAIAIPQAQADAPNPLAPALRAIFWRGVCDSLSQNEDTDCTKTPARCWAKRASWDETFEPVFDLESTHVGWPYVVDRWLLGAATSESPKVKEDSARISQWREDPGSHRS